VRALVWRSMKAAVYGQWAAQEQVPERVYGGKSGNSRSPPALRHKAVSAGVQVGGGEILPAVRRYKVAKQRAATVGEPVVAER